MDETLEERIHHTLYAPRKKKWHKRWWGRLTILAGIIVVGLIVLFVGLTIYYYRAYTTPIPVTKTDDFLENLKVGATADLLYSGKDPSKGPAKARVQIVAFEDFGCPYTLEAQPFIKKLIASHPLDVRFIFKDFPLTKIHPMAQSAAEAAQCAYEQGKFWEFHDELFASQDGLSEAFYRSTAKKVGMNISAFNECFATGKTKKQISEDVAMGRTFGVIGTPTFFINGFPVSGYPDDPAKQQEFEKSFEDAIEVIKKL